MQLAQYPIADEIVGALSPQYWQEPMRYPNNPLLMPVMILKEKISQSLYT
jgi:hypothetical protein